MMSDQDLQRFAEMHKQDPYMFPLAFNESNMRKELRSAPQGQQPGAAQPPVNQQALAAMQPAPLPEDQGIGALNPNMQFADGGLVSFAGGGEATSGPYAQSDGMDFGAGGMTYADGGAVRFADGGTARYPYGWDPALVAERKARREAAALAAASQAATPEQLQQMAADEKEAADLRASIGKVVRPVAGVVSDIATAPYRQAANLYDKAALVGQAVGVPLPRVPKEYRETISTAFPSLATSPPAATPEEKQAKAAVDEATRLKAVIAAPAPSPAPDTTSRATRSAPSAAASPKGIAALADKFDPVADANKLFENAAAEQAKRDAEREKEYLANRPESESFKERRAALEEGKQDVDKQQRMNEGLAWLSFASRVVQPGKTAIQAIVEGASVGAEQYNKAQGELKRAEKERKLGLAALSESERAAARGDQEKAQARMDAANNRFEAMKNAQVGAVATAMNTQTKIAADVLQNQMNNDAAMQRQQLSNQGAMDVARLRASAGDGGAQPSKLALELEKSWLKLANTPGGLQMFKAQYPNFNNTREGYMKIMGYGGAGAGSGARSGFEFVDEPN
jgi:hypothetical protein